MEMVKEQENGVVTENNTTLVNQNLMELNICFHQILETCSNMNGRFMYAMHKNINTLTPYLKSINDARSAIINQYAELDKNGKPKLEKTKDGEEPKFIYKNGSEKKAIKAFNEILTEKVDIKFYKIDSDTFGEVTNLDIKNISSLGAFMDLIIKD